MTASIIQVIFNAVIVAKLTYAASSWWGFTTADDRQRLQAVVRRGIRSGLCVPDHKTVADILTEADDKLFSLILHDKYHFLHSLYMIVQIFSKRQRITLRLLYAMSRPSVCLSVCLLSVCLLSVCL